jgi:hypothetical protein
MAFLFRTSKSARDWTIGDLDAYNIKLVRKDATTFFQTQDLPQPQVSPEILNIQEAREMELEANQELINLLDLAMVPRDSAVDVFTISLFRALGYTTGHRIACCRKDIPLLIRNEWKISETDVCLIDRLQDDDIILLVQESNGGGEPIQSDAEAQLIAKTIGTFTLNNRRRWESGKQELQSKVGLTLIHSLNYCNFIQAHLQVIPGIVMTGTTPIFYTIPVTDQLVTAIRQGTYPPTVTEVSVHIPDIPSPERRWSEGMKPLDNRQHILKCYEAFKKVIGI